MFFKNVEVFCCITADIFVRVFLCTPLAFIYLFFASEEHFFLDL